VTLEWVIGDHFGHAIPTDPDALLAGGPRFLTEAFSAWGALSDGNAVSRITGEREIPGGSTGRKPLMTVEYEKSEPQLHTELFVKFSRDADNQIRDHAYDQIDQARAELNAVSK
jgi:hypothetical protein